MPQTSQVPSWTFFKCFIRIHLLIISFSQWSQSFRTYHISVPEKKWNKSSIVSSIINLNSPVCIKSLIRKRNIIQLEIVTKLLNLSQWTVILLNPASNLFQVTPILGQKSFLKILPNVCVFLANFRQPFPTSCFQDFSFWPTNESECIQQVSKLQVWNELIWIKYKWIICIYKFKLCLFLSYAYFGPIIIFLI